MVRLGDIATYINGYAFKPTDWSSEGVPIIRIQDLTGNSYQANRYNGKYDAKYEVNYGDVLISWSASLGVYVWEGEKAVLNQHIFKVQFDKADIDRDFFVHQVGCILNNASGEAHGATMKHLTKPVFDALLFYLPTIEDQKKIANELNKVSDLISLRKQQLSKLDELVKSRFIELFGNIKNNHQRYPVIKIGSCAKLQGGFAFKSSNYLNDGIRLVQISNVNKYTLDWDSINCVPQAFLQKYKDFELHVGDLVLAMTRPVIKSLDAVKIATVSENDVPSLLNQRVGRFVVDRKKLHSVYLMVLCQMPEFREYVEAMSGNSLQPNISSKQVEDYSIVLPPLTLQEQFAAFVKQIDKSKFEIQKSLEKLETLKKALMQKYFG